MDLAEAQDIKKKKKKKGGKNNQTYTTKILMTQITMMAWSLT